VFHKHPFKETAVLLHTFRLSVSCKHSVCPDSIATCTYQNTRSQFIRFNVVSHSYGCCTVFLVIKRASGIKKNPMFVIVLRSALITNLRDSSAC
jgi:hypothetical protein